jgi:RNA polymerase sigma factor (TIGR02999 family)
VGRALAQLIQQVGAGEPGARDALFSAAYSKLRKLARSRLRDGGRNTFLETTALVQESYLRFLNSGQLHIEDRRAFFAYASKVMRSVIIDSVREHQAQRRGGDLIEATLDTQAGAGRAERRGRNLARARGPARTRASRTSPGCGGRNALLRRLRRNRDC